MSDAPSLTSPLITTLPPPAITNPLTPQLSPATAPSVTIPIDSIITASAASISVTNVTGTVVQQIIKEKKEDVKISNVPSVFIPPAYVNRPSTVDSATPLYDADDIESSISHQSVPHSARPRLTGHTVTAIPHMHDASRPAINFAISNDDLQFELKPSYIGSPAAPIIYYNAHDVAWYRQVLPNPSMRIWVLIKNTSFVLNTANNVGYVKRRLVETAVRNNIQITLMNPNKFDLSVSALSNKNSIVYNGKRIEHLPDAVIPRVGANVDYLGLAVLRQLEACGILVFNPVNSIEISRDKLYTHQVLAANLLSIPRSMLSRYPIEYDYIEKYFSYPIVVKLASGSRGEAVWLVKDRENFQSLIDGNSIDKTKPIIVQEYLASTQGRDIRCLVIGDRVVASCMRVGDNQSFKANFHAGGSVLPVNIDQPLADMAIKAAKLCGLTFSGVDILLGQEGYCVCEVNSSPGFEGLEKATEVDCAQAMIDYVRDTVKQRQSSASTTIDSQSSWRAQERHYPLQEDHLELIRQVKAQAEREQKVSQNLQSTRASTVSA